MKKILVLCTGNSCRSQMAHGYLEKSLNGQAEIYSAGIETHGLNPRAVTIMSEDNIDISTYTSNHIDEYQGIDFDYVITVCDNAKESCPVFPSSATVLHQSFPDPAKAIGEEEVILDSFRQTRNAVKAYIDNFITDNFK